MTTPRVPGAHPSPFDPAPWPPWDKITAAGAGELYGAMIRGFDAQAQVDGFSLVTWAKARVAEAERRGAISAADAHRLATLVAPPPGAPSARQLFDEALADPASTATTIGILSIASYEEEHARTDDVSPFELGVILAMTGGIYVMLTVELAKHIDVRVTIS